MRKRGNPAGALILSGVFLAAQLTAGSARPMAAQQTTSGTSGFVAAPASQPLGVGSWSANVIVNDETGQNNARWPAIAADANGNAYAVWTGWHGSVRGIYFSYRPSGGPWGPASLVNDAAGTQAPFFPAIAVDAGGNAYAVWEDCRNSPVPEIYFSYRPAGGSWGANARVSDVGASAEYRPSIAVDASGNAYAAWYSRRTIGWDIYFAYRPAGGSWGPNVRVDDDGGTADQMNPTIAVDAGGNARSVWEDERDGTRHIRFAYRPAGGAWGTSEEVNDEVGTAPQYSPAVATDSSGSDYVVWGDTRSGDGDIRFAYRPAGGAWGASERVNDDAGANLQGNPSIAVDASGKAHVIWIDERSGMLIDNIYASERPPGGVWAANVRVNDNEWGRDVDPSVAVHANGTAFAVWEDNRNIYSDIYFSYRLGVHAYLPFAARQSCSPFRDDFSNPASGWPTGDESLYSYGYLNGEYRILSKQSGFFYLFSSPSCLRANYVVEADARWVGTPGNGYGLVFGVTNGLNQYYLFDVNTDSQRFRLLRRNASGGFTTLVPYTVSSAIQAGTAANHLKAARDGAQIALEVNGVALGTWSDGTITGLTNAGLVMNPYINVAVADARFDNFLMCDPGCSGTGALGGVGSSSPAVGGAAPSPNSAPMAGAAGSTGFHPSSPEARLVP